MAQEEELMEEDQERPLRELQEELSDLKVLVEHRGYKRLMLIAQRQIEANTNEVILKKLDSMDDVLQQEQAKGIVQGMMILTGLIPTEIERLEAEIEEKLKESENVDFENAEQTAGT